MILVACWAVALVHLRLVYSIMTVVRRTHYHVLQPRHQTLGTLVPPHTWMWLQPCFGVDRLGMLGSVEWLRRGAFVTPGRSGRAYDIANVRAHPDSLSIGWVSSLSLILLLCSAWALGDVLLVRAPPAPHRLGSGQKVSMMCDWPQKVLLAASGVPPHVRCILSPESCPSNRYMTSCADPPWLQGVYVKTLA